MPLTEWQFHGNFINTNKIKNGIFKYVKALFFMLFSAKLKYI